MDGEDDHEAMSANSGHEDEDESGSAQVVPNHKKQAYLPGKSRDLKDDEELTFDKQAYRMYHPFTTERPCLSFDPLMDDDGDNRDSYPLTCRLVAGTQAERSRDNGLLTMKLANITPIKAKKDDDDDDDESESEDEEDDEKKAEKTPAMHAALIPHQGGVNRIRATRLGASTVCAVWNDQCKVQIWNLTPALKAVNEMTDKKTQSTTLKKEKPLFSFVGHQSEGFALDWSSVSTGRLASGDNMKRIHVWSMGEGGQWAVDQRPLTGHTGSVEDIQWSPTEENVFASCSADGSIRLWDARAPAAEACVCTVANAHDSDVNVISWNSTEPFLLSGGDDGELKVWDLKLIQYGQAVARFKHHSKPITSVQWNPKDSTVFMASGEDDQTTIWDLALEADDGDETEKIQTDEPTVPPQLLFIHMGQEEVKEVRWHRQLTGVALTTALSGFNIFRTINV